MEEKTITLKGFEISARDIPANWPVCFLEGCPHSGDCMRHAVMPLLEERVTRGHSIYPAALRAEGGCPHRVPIRVVRMAWGIKPLFANVLQRDAAPLRAQVQAYLGSHSTYYRYNDGTNLLGPKRQQGILDIFASYGYTEGLAFGHYVEKLCF
jgi:hypothetical protein